MDNIIIPHSFDYIESTTAGYYTPDGVCHEDLRLAEFHKIHMTVLEKYTQYFTGKNVYRIRRESDEGWVDEDFYTEEEILKMLESTEE